MSEMLDRSRSPKMLSIPLVIWLWLCEAAPAAASFDLSRGFIIEFLLVRGYHVLVLINYSWAYRAAPAGHRVEQWLHLALKANAGTKMPLTEDGFGLLEKVRSYSIWLRLERRSGSSAKWVRPTYVGPRRARSLWNSTFLHLPLFP